MSVALVPHLAAAGHLVAAGAAGHMSSGSMGSMGSMGTEPAITLHTLLTDWTGGPFAALVAVGLAAIAGWYVLSVRRLAGRGRRWSGWRTASFMAGLVAVELALGSSVASLSDFTFTSHVLQHLLLMIIAPPLAALGAPMTLLLQTSGRPVKRVALRGLHSGAFHVLSHPVPVFFLYYLSMYAFFLTGALGYAMAHMWLMDLINLGFLGGATLFWWPMVGLDPIPGGGLDPGFKIINLLIGVPIESFLGIALLMKSTSVAPIYTLTSTHTGGGVLWAATEVATIGALLPIYVQWTRADARRAARIDARLDAGGVATPVVEGQGMAATFRSLRRG
jgi:putative membrane protein